MGDPIDIGFLRSQSLLGSRAREDCLRIPFLQSSVCAVIIVLASDGIVTQQLGATNHAIHYTHNWNQIRRNHFGSSPSRHHFAPIPTRSKPAIDTILAKSYRIFERTQWPQDCVPQDESCPLSLGLEGAPVRFVIANRSASARLLRRLPPDKIKPASPGMRRGLITRPIQRI